MSQGITPHGTNIEITAPAIRPTWQNIAATSGSDTTVAIALHYGSVWVPGSCFVTGIGYLVGSAGTTGKVIVSLHDDGGTVLAQSAVAGATIGTAAEYQEVSFSTPYTITKAGIYLLAVTFNEAATRKFRTVPAQCGAGMMAGSATQTFTTIASFTPSTTRFTADKAPIAYLI